MRVSVGENDVVDIGRLKPAFQSERCDPSVAIVEFWFVVLKVRERDHRQVLVALHRLHGARRKSQRRRVDVRRRVPVLAERRVAVAHVHDPHRETRRRVAERQAAIRPVVEALRDEHVVDRRRCSWRWPPPAAQLYRSSWRVL